MTGSELKNGNIEIINSTNSKTKICSKNWSSRATYPRNVANATGGVFVDSVVICGGDPYTKTCFKIGIDLQWTKLSQLSIERFGSASIVIDDYLWVTGGDNGQAIGNTILKTSEKVSTEILFIPR